MPVIVSLINEATPASLVDGDEVRAWLGSPEDIELVLVVGEQDEPLAYADLGSNNPESDRIWLDLRVPARNEDDETIGAPLDWAEEIARASKRRLIRVVTSPAPRVASCLERRGYRPIRRFFRMRVDLDAPPPEPEWPPGIVVRALEPGEERAVFEAAEDAFSDHWEWERGSFEGWAHFMVEGPDFDPSLWLVALAGDEIAAVCICRLAAGSQELGWVRELAVRRSWRRRGLGTALLHASFSLFWDRGIRSVGLGVDGENTTGAVRIYERAGMRVVHHFDAYEKELA